MKTYLRCTLAIITLISLSGCGLKGPLYFPPEDTQAKMTQSSQPIQQVESASTQTN
ncbi:LPS translocon maturation chaperone LptM [Proteus terrae]|uniref:LPS translocon maturation chaperone LptM n=1 Tax=Proteus terrae TaxID=1574161 RepID=UPI002872661C|nr:lipoprotein [Proteus terrae]MDR9743436.1 lipoprotein [Proteus terrae]